MKKYLLLIYLVITASIFSQEIKLSKDTLFFPAGENFQKYPDSLYVHNVGSDTLRINELVGDQRQYNLSIFLKDTVLVFYFQGWPHD